MECFYVSVYFCKMGAGNYGTYFLDVKMDSIHKNRIHHKLLAMIEKYKLSFLNESFKIEHFKVHLFLTAYWVQRCR